MAAVPPAEKRRSGRIIIAAIIIVAVVAIPTIFLLRQAPSGGPPSTVKISGTATVTGYGTPIAVAFIKQYSDEGPYVSMIVNGTYSLTVPNNTLYVTYIDFQPPTSASGTCGGMNASGVDTVFLDSGTGNSTLTYDLSCANPHTSSFP